MIVYTHENGYGNVNIKEMSELINTLPDANQRLMMRELLFDYEVLRRVIDGPNFIFQHADGSETRRIKIY
jgi:hypothetical protein